MTDLLNAKRYLLTPVGADDLGLDAKRKLKNWTI
jgi:hypothetical protein